ncbi:MAG TPA: hypothetical protein VHI50_06820 [Micromonosporaceae bacterium]|jgi:hypothetical protein|nr:hypothetical protein [Micromonosporaceae bacterium]
MPTNVDDVRVNGSAVPLASAAGNWSETTGVQENNWTVQIVAGCDLTPGVSSTGESTDGAGNWVYRFEGDAFRQGGLVTKCANGAGNDFAVVVSNLPTGDLQYLDADYTFRVTNTNNNK